MPQQLRSVTVAVQDVKGQDTIPRRNLVLRAPNWLTKIGRGTHTGEGELEPSEDNAWFESRVMSRNHAVLTANPDTKEVFIKDVGSMHGTLVAARRLTAHVKEKLYDEDVIIFGADVTRGDSYFPALEVMINISWSFDESSEEVRSYLPEMSRNSFSADYSDDEEASWQDDISDGSHREQSVEVIIPPRRYSIAESDLSDDSLETSDVENDQESPSSAPLVSDDHEKMDEDNDDIIVISDGPARKLLSSSVAAIGPNEEKEPVGDPKCSEAANNDEAVEYLSESDYDDSEFLAEDQGDMASSDAPNHIQSVPSDEAPVQTMTIAATPYNHQAPTLPSQLSMDPKRSVRPPSPSDAAMAKPAPVSRPPPFGRHTLADIISWGSESQPMSGSFSSATYSRADNAWAGHNSVLYEPMPAADRNANPFSFSYLPNGSAWPEMDTVNYNLDFSNLQQPEMSFQTHPGSKVPTAGGSAPQVAGNISDSANAAQQPRPNLKRKADDITRDPRTMTEEACSIKTGNDEDMNSQQIMRGTEDDGGLEYILPTSSSTEPSRKKCRRNKHRSRQVSTGSKIARYAATALAGVALGAVGTVFGLAALPQDYFV